MSAGQAIIYDRVDSEISGYRAEIRYDSGDGSIAPFLLPGCYDTFEAARDRARKIKRALIQAGETGIYAYVGFSGERPPCFPRNGVKL